MKAAVFAYFIQYCRHIVRSQAHSESGFSDTCLVPALPASIKTQADLACVGSTLCFQPEQARQNKKASSAKCSLKLIILRMKRDSNSRRILPSHAFEACSLDRSDIHPHAIWRNKSAHKRNFSIVNHAANINSWRVETHSRRCAQMCTYAPPNARAGNALATKLALEVHWTSNLSEFPLRVAFARAVLRSSRSSRKLRKIPRQMFNKNDYSFTSL